MPTRRIAANALRMNACWNGSVRCRQEGGHADGRRAASSSGRSAEGRLQIVNRENLCRRSGGNDAPVQHDADIRRPLRHGQIVRGEDDRLAGRAEIVQDLEHQRLRRRVDSGKRLVEEDRRRPPAGALAR